nr:hypothetical protein [uncultured Caldimonas sp.]
MARSATATASTLHFASGFRARWRGEMVRRWQALPPALRSPRTVCLLALTAALVLLLAFHQVVAQAVQRAEARRTAWSNTAYAMTRCSTLPQPELRESCRARAMAGIVPAEPPLETERLAGLD